MMGALVGCGGSSSGINNGPGPVDAGGGIDQQTISAPVAINGTNEPQTFSFGGNDVTVPPTISFGQNEPIAIVQAGTFIFSDLFFEAEGGEPTAVDQFRKGRVYFRPNVGIESAGQDNENATFFDTGAKISQGFSGNVPATLDRDLALPDGNYLFRVEGPFRVGRGNRRLTIQRFYVGVQITNGVASLPDQIEGQIPSNGGSSVGLSVTADVPTEFTGRNFQLFIEKDNGNLSQTRPATGGSVTFSDLVDNGNSTIPSFGVESVRFGIVGSQD